MVVMMIMMTAVVGQRADCYLGLGGGVGCLRVLASRALFLPETANYVNQVCHTVWIQLTCVNSHISQPGSMNMRFFLLPGM